MQRLNVNLSHVVCGELIQVLKTKNAYFVRLYYFQRGKIYF